MRLDEGTDEDIIKIGKTPIIVIDLIGKLLRNLIDKLVKKPIIVIDSLVRYLGVFFSRLKARSYRGPHNRKILVSERLFLIHYNW